MPRSEQKSSRLVGLEDFYVRSSFYTDYPTAFMRPGVTGGIQILVYRS